MSQLKGVIRRAAKRDLVRYYGWLCAEAGTDTAERFMASVSHSYAELALNPGLGAEIGSRNIRLERLRKWRIDGFTRMMIFYVPSTDEIRVLRVLNASQDWWTLLDVD